MMDIDCIPPPPAEEFEEPGQCHYSSLHEVPLPPGENNNGSVGYGTNRAMEWQRAMEALNQSNQSNPSTPQLPFASYSGYGYGAPYGSHLPSQFAAMHTPSSAYPNLPVQYAQMQSPSSASVSSPSTTTFPARTVQHSFARTRMSRGKLAPYGLTNLVSDKKDINSNQNAYPSHLLSQPFGAYAPLLATPHSRMQSQFQQDLGSLDADSVETTGPTDMELEDDTGAMGSASSYSYGASYSQNNPQRHAPGAGGIRFQLSKKTTATEVKVSTPFLQRRLQTPHTTTHIQPQRLSFANHPDSTTASGTKTERVSRFSSVDKKSLEAPGEALSNVHSTDWPASLQDYVARAIEVTAPEKREQVMQVITQRISNAYKTNTVHSTKWQKEPMPSENEATAEFFGLSPKREKQVSSHSSPQAELASPNRSFSGSSITFRRGRGGGGATRNSRVSSRRDSEGSSGDEDKKPQYYSSKFSPSKGKGRKSESALTKRHSDEDRDSEPEFIPLGKCDRATSSTGKKGKTPKNGQGKKASQSAPRGKLMSFGVEEPMSGLELEKLRRRQERFGDLSNAGETPCSVSGKKAGKNKPAPSTISPSTISFRAQRANDRKVSAIRTVVGTCQTIEKQYFRLTDEVDPSQVRPVHILEESLKLIREKWKKNHDYHYAESQLKSIRQDLRVQHVFSAFTVSVYETHARIALEVGDQAEFTQCLSQLEWLYDTLTAVAKHAASKSTGLNGQAQDNLVVAGCQNRREFLSYRILYVMRQNRTTDAAKARMKLSVDDKKDVCIAFAFSVLSAYFAGDYQQFFTLYKIAPKMASYVMDVAVPIFRQKTFVKLCTAYRPTLPVLALKDILCFPSEPEVRQFLKGYKLTYTWLNGCEEIDTKASLAAVKGGAEVVVDTPKPTPIHHKSQEKIQRNIKSSSSLTQLGKRRFI